MLSVLNPHARCHASVILVLMGLYAVSGPASPTAFAATGPPAWSAIPLPGDRAQLCRIAGLDERTDAARLSLELVRILYGTPATSPPGSQKTFSAILEYLRSSSETAGGPRELVPAPLPARLWRDVVLPRARPPAAYRTPERLSAELERAVVPEGQTVDDNHLFAAIMSNRSAALLFYGLAALDDETLAYVSGRPVLLGWIAAERPGTLAACGGALRLVRELVQVPGGEAAQPLWEELVGEQRSSADRFIRALLARDNGRLAYFFESLAALDQPHLRFAVGAAVPDPRRRQARFLRLYEAFAGVDPAWSLEIGPFTRRVDDGRLLLSLVAVTPDGQLAAPASAHLWKSALEMVVSPASADDAAADAATIAQLVLTRDWRVRRQRMRALRFAQRVFAEADERERQNVILALQNFQRFETLHLTIERMGITDPRIFVKAGTRAAFISGEGWFRPADAREKATLLSQFQGALALIDHCTFRGTFDLRARRHLVETLIAVPVSALTGYAGGIARWITTTALPEVRAALDESAAEDAEDLVLEGLAGLLPPGSSTLPAVRWEDHDYAIDQGAVELTRLLLVRQRQGGNRLDDVLALADQAAKLKAGAGADAARLQLLAKSLRPSELRTVGREKWTDQILKEQLLEASRVASAGGFAKPEVADRLVTLADEMLGDALRSLAYAAHIGDPENNILLGPSLADDHDFGLREPDVPPIVAAWTLPTERMGGGIPWHIAGSLLCLDTVLGRFSLPRKMGAPPASRRLGRRDEQALAHAAVLARPADLDDVERDRLVAAIARGRQLADAAADPTTVLALGETAGIDPRRRHVMAWLAGQAPSRGSGMFTLTELLRIGAGTKAVRVNAAWGASAVGLDGCPCLQFPDEPPPDGYGWLSTSPVAVSAIPDLSLRLAEMTVRLGVPAAMVALLLPDATQELLETAQPAYADDWIALARAAGAISESRRVEAIASLTAAGGPLIPRGPAVRHD